MKFEIERLNEAIRQSRISQEECSNQQLDRQQDMEELIFSIEQKEKEYDETRKVSIICVSNMATSIR